MESEERTRERHPFIQTLTSWSLIGVPEMASFLNMHPETVRRKLASGEWPGCNIGGRWRIDPIDVAIIFVARRQGRTWREFRDTHGSAAVEHVVKYVVEIRKVLREEARLEGSLARLDEEEDSHAEA